MSRIYFHSPEARAEVRGSERGYMGTSIARWFYASLDVPNLLGEPDAPFFELLPKDCYLMGSLREAPRLAFAEYVRIWLASASADVYFVIGSHKVDVFSAQLNTACLMGGDSVKLLARLHGQCESHCYIEGQDREWLAQIIEKGLNTALYRREQGWESVISLLRNGMNSPVVTSYSVCQQFPDSHFSKLPSSLDKNGEKDWDKWYDLLPSERWRLAIEGVRQSAGSLRLDPEAWKDFYFSHGWDAFKLSHLLGIPSWNWNNIAKCFAETQLPATEAWVETLKNYPY